MSTEKNSMGQQIGSRAKKARMLSGLSRKKFSEISGISPVTLKIWEDPPKHRSGLTKKGADRLISALNKMEIICTFEWLLSGTPPGPKIIHDESLDFLDNEITWGEEESILKDINSFKENNPNATIAIISDGSMLPLYTYGDYIAGSKVTGKKIEQLISLNCIIETESQTIIRRISSVCNGRYTLTSLNQELNIADTVMVDVKIISAAEITWHRWRKKKNRTLLL